MGCGASTVAPGVDVTSAGTNGHELSKASNGTGHPGPRASEPVATRKPEMSRSKTELLKPDRRSEGDGAGAPGLSWTPEQVTSRPRSMSLQPASSFSQGDSPTSFSRVSLAQDGSFAGGSSSGGSDNGAESSPRSARKTRSMSYTRNRSMSVQSKDPVLRFTEYVQAEEHKKQRKHGRIVMSSPQTEVQMRAQMDKLKTTNNLPDHVRCAFCSFDSSLSGSRLPAPPARPGPRVLTLAIPNSRSLFFLRNRRRSSSWERFAGTSSSTA